jgi:hypothetical protein
MERTWRTKGWNHRLFQKVMGKLLVNGFLSITFLDRPGAGSPLSLMWWRMRCAQTRRRRPTMLPQEGPELKNSQEFRKAPWHHHWRGSKKHGSKGDLVVWVAYGSRDQATRERSVTHMEHAYIAQADWILILPRRFGCVRQLRLALVDANAIASICMKC